MNLSISVIIPAYNAAGTIAETIESLLSQNFKDWEAIVVDDGSTDQTVNIVNGYRETDNRIQLISQPNLGLAGARNTGIKYAHFEWILFLDADDWISVNFLARMTGVLKENPYIDAVHCGWSIVAPGGQLTGDKYASPETDMFPSFVRTCAFVIHSCIIRKELVILSGGFDTAFEVCADWDFWQRISRTGARFVSIREVHSYYRMRPDSLSKKVNLSLVNSLKIINQGHLYDPRVPLAHPGYKNGIKSEQLNIEQLYCLTWFAGLYIGQGEDARPFLDLLDKDCTSHLDPNTIANYIFEAVCFSTCEVPAKWVQLWYKTNKHIKEFLIALETQSKTKGLLKSTLIILERMILQHGDIDTPLFIDTTYAVRVEVTESVPDIYPPAMMERLMVKVEMEGNNLGIIELPVCGKMVSGWLIKDAIAAEFAWQILGRFFELTVYPEILERYNLQTKKDGSSENIHDKIGWTVFQQQLLVQTNPKYIRYNKLERLVKTNIQSILNSGLSAIEISKELSKIIVRFKKPEIILTIGGVVWGIIDLPCKNLTLSSETLKEIINNIINEVDNFELCRICVREALIGRPLSEPTSLRERLAKAATLANDSGKNADSQGIPYFSGADFVTRKTAILAYRNGTMGTSSSRRAMLPVKLIGELIEMAKSAGEQVLQLPIPGDQPDHILYVPEIIKNLPNNKIRSINKPVKVKEAAKSSIENELSVVTQKLPILKYHHIAPMGVLNMKCNNVAPESFEEQLQYLRDNDYYSAKWDDWINAMFKHTPLPGKTVAITFDDGYFNFYQYAWPLLKKYGFIATVFLPTEFVGYTNSWNKDLFEEIPLMGWQQIIELQKEGIQFGSHSATHLRLTALSPTDIVHEAAQSRTTLQRTLKVPVKIVAYPYGDADPVVTHLFGACGYTLGLSSKQGPSTFNDNPLNLPRLEIKSSDSLQNFADKLNSK